MKKTYGVLKKIISLTTVITLLFSILSTANVNAASVKKNDDISNHWAKTVIEEWIHYGMANGYEDGSFKPNGNITRAEFMKLVNGAFDFTEETTIKFSDVPAKSWYEVVVKCAVAAGYISGYPDGTIRPNSPITREEAAVIIAKIKIFL